ncbi:MAG: IS110 family transposase [Thaumarchaeota archaeon]|nr:MAG: IS110 family transposase [Nitrososphaerota archaeon]
MNTFPDSHHLRAYAALIRSPRSCGGVTYNRRITETESKHLRWAMTECNTNVRTARDSNISTLHTMFAKKKGNAKTRVVAASKLLQV